MLLDDRCPALGLLPHDTISQSVGCRCAAFRPRSWLLATLDGEQPSGDLAVRQARAFWCDDHGQQLGAAIDGGCSRGRGINRAAAPPISLRRATMPALRCSG